MSSFNSHLGLGDPSPPRKKKKKKLDREKEGTIGRKKERIKVTGNDRKKKNKN